METRARKFQSRKKVRYGFIVIFFIFFAALQIWALKFYYKEVKFVIPKDLFSASANYPISELIVGRETEVENMGSEITEDTSSENLEVSATDKSTEEETTTTAKNNVFELSDIQKKIALRVMKLLEEDIEYQYQNYPETGYPNDKYWISTDVISVVLKDSGYDLMELLYNDMSEHIDAYPMDKKGTTALNKMGDFRVVYFQQKFFQRNALELPIEFNPNEPSNLLQWQPGDIVYFAIDEENPGKDVGGMISNKKSDAGIPLVIMITGDLGKISEVDALTTLKASGHYRYPYPELGDN